MQGIGACSNYSDYKICYFITVRYLHLQYWYISYYSNTLEICLSLNRSSIYPKVKKCEVNFFCCLSRGGGGGGGEVKFVQAEDGVIYFFGSPPFSLRPPTRP